MLLYYFVDFFKHVQNSSNFAQAIQNFFTPIKSEVEEILQKRNKNGQNKQVKSENELFIEYYELPLVQKIMTIQTPFEYDIIKRFASKNTPDEKKQFRKIMSIISQDSANGYNQSDYPKLTNFKTLITQKYSAMVDYVKNPNMKSNWSSDRYFNEFHILYRSLKR